MFSKYNLIFLLLFIVPNIICYNRKGAETITTTTTPEPNYELLAKELLENADHHYHTYLENIRDHIWTPKYIKHRQNIVSEADAKRTFRHQLIELCEKLKKLPYHKFNDEDLKRQVEILSDLQINGLDEQDYRRARYLLKQMNNFALTEKICDYQDPDKCTLSHVPEMDKRYKATMTQGELHHLWLKWRENVGPKARTLFEEYIMLYRKAAALNGHITPSRTWYMYYDDDHFIDELTRAIDEIQPLYRQLHAYIRHSIRTGYNDGSITDRSPIPQSYFYQALLQAWAPQPKFNLPYPSHVLPNITYSMEEQGYTAIHLIEKADNFYETMGLPALGRNFWDNNIQMKTAKEAGYDCKADIFNLIPDVALKYCPKHSYRTFLQMHGIMGKIQHQLHRNVLPIGLNRDPCPGFEDAIGEAVIISASTPVHLDHIGLTHRYDNNYDDHDLTMNRLLRFGVHTLFNLAVYFGNEKFWVDALNHAIPPNEYNCGYWRIQNKYVGVSPPEIRSEENFDLGYKFYKGIDDEKPSTIKVVSELMGYQIFKALCLKSKQYIPNRHEHALHNCDIYNNRDAGKVLSEVMSLGSKRTWREALYILTGEREISGKALLEYYQPLQNWLQEYNERNGIKVGWDSYTKCES